MKFEDLLLKKEEHPILHGTSFIIPIHPKILELKIDNNLANEVFPKIVDEWYNELLQYSTNSPESEEKRWVKEVFTLKKPKVRKERFRQIMTPLSWDDYVVCDEKGFATGLSISRDAGGSLYFANELGCEKSICYKQANRTLLFSSEKIKEFAASIDEEKNYAVIKCYSHHNVNYFPGALFLKNWAIAYMNEVFLKNKDYFVNTNWKKILDIFNKA